MGFLDKVKAGADSVAQAAQQTIQQGQDKLDDVQAKKKADGLLRDLGAWHYAVATGRDQGDAADEIARLTAELQAHEAANGPLDVGRKELPPPPPPPAPPTGAAPLPPGPTSPPPPPGSVPPPPGSVPPPPGSVPPPPGSVPPPPAPGAVPPPPSGAVPPPPGDVPPPPTEDPEPGPIPPPPPGGSF
ncbi:MAG: hypothetical protein ACTHN0_07790 [Aquihabitans sp.]